MLWSVHLEGGPRRVNHAAAAVGDRIYSFGGYCKPLLRPLKKQFFVVQRLQTSKNKLNYETALFVSRSLTHRVVPRKRRSWQLEPDISGLLAL